MLAKTVDTWYTDSSKTKDGVGVYNIREYENINLSNIAAIFQAEVVAITACVKAMMRKDYNNKRIRINDSNQIIGFGSGDIRSKIAHSANNRLWP